MDARLPAILSLVTPVLLLLRPDAAWLLGVTLVLPAELNFIRLRGILGPFDSSSAAPIIFWVDELFHYWAPAEGLPLLPIVTTLLILNFLKPADEANSVPPIPGMAPASIDFYAMALNPLSGRGTTLKGCGPAELVPVDVLMAVREAGLNLIGALEVDDPERGIGLNLPSPLDEAPPPTDKSVGGNRVRGGLLI